MNIMVLVVLLILVSKMVDGYKKGMVKEVISFISLIVLCTVAALISLGLHSYMEKEFVGVFVAILLLCILLIAHQLLGIVFFPAKLVSKLPVIHWVDKLLGMVVGALEVVLIIWTVYLFIMYMGLGMLGQQILAYTQESQMLSWLYKYNILADWVIKLGSNIGVL